MYTEKYKTLQASTPEDLDHKVHELIKEGFEPLGGHTSASLPQGVILFQTMVRVKGKDSNTSSEATKSAGA